MIPKPSSTIGELYQRLRPMVFRDAGQVELVPLPEPTRFRCAYCGRDVIPDRGGHCPNCGAPVNYYDRPHMVLLPPDIDEATYRRIRQEWEDRRV